MEKKIAVWSYWLGLLCVVLMVLLRGLAVLGIYPNLVPQEGAPINYNTFLRGAVVLLLVSIASGQLDRWRSEKP